MGPHSELWLWEPANAQSGQYNNAVLTGAFVRGGGQGLAVRGEDVAIDPDAAEPEVTPETSQIVNQWVNTLSVQPR